MRTMMKFAVLLAATTALSSGPAYAGTDRDTDKDKGEAAAAQVQATKADQYASLKYRLVGPFRGGRAAGVSGVVQDPAVYYFGSAAGGLWKTTDAGHSWKPLWDHFPEASPAVGAVVVAPSDPNVVYAGTGEANIRGNVVTGNGIFKSTDAGKTWAFAGLPDSGAIGRMAVDPNDPNTLLVAALGHPFGANDQRGIFRSTDGGKTWARTLFVDAKTGAVDVQYDPANPKVVYAGMWQVLRQPWMFESGGPGSGLYKSTDGGVTWQKLTGHGLPGGVLGRVGVAPTSDPNKVYALIEAENGGLYRTDDGGENWKLVNSENKFRQRAWYYTNVFVDPKNPDTVFIMNTGAYKSINGGKSFETMPTFHGDNHQLWINPNNPQYMVNSNDGGGNVSVDGGKTWTTGMNQATAQFYHVSVDNRFPYHIYGAQQDNTTVEIASASLSGPISTQDWHSVGGGESGYVVAKPDDPSIVIANAYQGSVTRYDDRTKNTKSINPWARQVMGWAPKDLEHRAQWTEPLAFSPFDPNVLYNANEVVFKSTDLGQNWKIISPDLTRNDKSKQLSSGGPLTKDNTSIEVYGTIFSLVESPVQKDLIWVGTDDGLIQLTTDGGANWSNVTPKAMPEWGTVSMIEADPRKPGSAYAAIDCHRLDDFTPHAFRTDDFGKTWVPIIDGLPADAYIHAIRVDPTRPGLLYAGTEKGIFVSYTDGARWEPLQLNLPRTPVNDLVVKDNSLVVATHGRSFWVLDDLTPVRQWSDAVEKSAFHLFAPAPVTRVVYSNRGDLGGSPAGANPPSGLVLDYFLKSGTARPAPGAKKDDDHDAAGKDGKRKPGEGRVKIAIFDAANNLVASYPVPPPKHEADADEDEDEGFGKAPKITVTDNVGLNQFVWDMRYQGARPIPRSSMWGASLEGPLALPGRYKAVVTVDGKSQAQPFEIVPDPRINVSAADLQEQFDLSNKIIAELKLVQTAILEMRSVHVQLAAIRAKVKDGKVRNGDGVLKAADTLETSTTALEDELIQRKSIANEDPLAFPIRLNNMIASLNAQVNRGVGAPSAAQEEEYRTLKARADALLAQWADLKKTDLVTFNGVAQSSSMQPVEPVALLI